MLIDPAALAEPYDAAGFYKDHAGAALGGAFVNEFERSAKLLLANPGLGSLGRAGLRKYPLRRFPYLIVYQIVGDELRIIALAHQRRRPGYWRKRT